MVLSLLWMSGIGSVDHAALGGATEGQEKAAAPFCKKAKPRRHLAEV
jgi:hypothetical protein